MFATLSTKVLLTIYPLSEFNCLANSCIQWVVSVPPESHHDGERNRQTFTEKLNHERDGSEITHQLRERKRYPDS